MSVCAKIIRLRRQPLNSSVSSQMVVRILMIAFLSPIGGFPAYFLSEYFLAPEELMASSLELWVFMAFLAWFVVASCAFALGLGIHLATRPRRIDATTLLLLFVVVALAFTWVVGRPDLQFLGLGTAITAWILYCWSPLQLWRRDYHPR